MPDLVEESDASAATDAELAEALHGLAWTIHRRAPERAGVNRLPITEAGVVKQVLESPGATVGELSEALGLLQPNTSAAVRSLVQRGLVVREPSPDDRRVVRIVPTAAAEAERSAILEAWAGSLDLALARMDVADRAALRRAAPALRALQRAIRDASL